jgi:dihydrofolate reductase
MPELTYCVACSLDNFIAHHDDSHDGFCFDRDYLMDLAEQFPDTFPIHLRSMFGIDAENQWFDTVLMGRKTYDVGFKAGVTNPYPHLQQYLFSKSLKVSPDEQVTLVSEDAVQFVEQLKQQSGKGIWLCGGASLASTLFSAGLIDRFILKINPFLMGEGIPLFAGVIPQTALTLTGQKIYDNGVVILHYQIDRVTSTNSI